MGQVGPTWAELGPTVPVQSMVRRTLNAEIGTSAAMRHERRRIEGELAVQFRQFGDTGGIWA